MKNQYTADEKFILGIRGFIADAQRAENPPDAWQLLSNIAHDIGEWRHNREKDFFSPRTARFQPKDFNYKGNPAFELEWEK